MKRETLDVKIFYTSLASPIGTIYIASTPAGICAISISVTEEIFLSEIKEGDCPRIRGRMAVDSGLSPYRYVRDDKRFTELKKDLKDYFSGKKVDFHKYLLDISSGTEFQKKVWNKLLEIPSGETRGYKWLAEAVGSPKGFRAVGGANGNNPIPILIPCHRVINSDGTLGGYSGGVWIKEFLLKLEDVSVRNEEKKP